MSNEPRIFKSVRAKCLDCAGSPGEVRFCPVIDCPLWVFRFGSKPKAARRRLGEKGKDLLDKSNFVEGAKFGPNKTTSETE